MVKVRSYLRRFALAVKPFMRSTQTIFYVFIVILAGRMFGGKAGLWGIISLVSIYIVYLSMWLFLLDGLRHIHEGAELVFVVLTGRPSDKEMWDKGDMKELVKHGFNWRGLNARKVEDAARRKESAEKDSKGNVRELQNQDKAHSKKKKG